MNFKKLKALYFKELNYSKKNLAFINDFLKIKYIDKSHNKIKFDKETNVLFTTPNFILSKFEIEKMPELMSVVSNTTGESHIDVEYCKKKNIKVFSLLNEQKFLSSITPTSEYTIGLMICLLRNIIPAFDHVKLGKWSRWNFGSALMLSKMTIGIIGLGRIGKKVARVCEAFGMKIVYHDLKKKNTKFKYYKTLNSLCSVCDIISLHVPYTSITKNLLGETFFNNVKIKKPYIINTARGEIICEKSLLKALKNNYISGAALDVMSSEFSSHFQKSKEKKELIKLSKKKKNLIITPHIAGSTKDAWHLTQERVIRKCFKYLKTINAI